MYNIEYESMKCSAYFISDDNKDMGQMKDPDCDEICLARSLIIS